LPQQEAVDRDFRYYYRVVALELLLVHHGYRRCEKTSVDPGSLDVLIDALQAFQRDRNLPTDTSLDAAFWNELVVPVKLGDHNSAVLALQWLLTSTSEAARPPMWDAASVNRHDCKASFDHTLEVKLVERSDITWVEATQQLRYQGIENTTWRTLLQAKEVRECTGCNNRAIVVRVFAVAWVVIWCAIAVVFAITHNDGWGHVIVASDSGASLWSFKASHRSCLDFIVHQISTLKVPKFCRPTGVIFAMMVSHNLAVLGAWSFPSDLVAQILIGLMFTGGAIIAVRLASVHTPRTSLSKRLVEVGGFAVCNMGIYVCMLFIPFRHRMWFAVLLVVMMVFWGGAQELSTARWNPICEA
jgi:hypothetical protein